MPMPRAPQKLSLVLTSSFRSSWMAPSWSRSSLSWWKARWFSLRDPTSSCQELSEHQQRREPTIRISWMGGADVVWLLTAAGVEVDALRLVEVLAFGLALFSFFTAGAFLVVEVLVLVAVVFFGAAVFSFFGALVLVSELFCGRVSQIFELYVSRTHTFAAASFGGEGLLGADSFFASLTGPEVPFLFLEY